MGLQTSSAWRGAAGCERRGRHKYSTRSCSRERYMQTKTLRQTVTFKASPHEVYDILMDSKKHRSLSGEPAKISKKVGGKFTAWGSHLSGINLVLKPGKKIVQASRGKFSDVASPRGSAAQPPWQYWNGRSRTGFSREDHVCLRQSVCRPDKATCSWQS
jgi:hypothetical protein